MIPRRGRIVLYTLTERDATAISRQRSLPNSGRGGNPTRAGDVFPLIITQPWGETEGCAVNGQVLLDGNDSLWVSSVQEGEGPRTWQVPTRD